ncbi:UDP-glycosyltransferase 91C1 [Linum perenne]
MLSSLISFIKLPLSPVKNLPPNAEATSDLEVKEFGYLKRAYDLLQQPLCQYLRSTTLHHDFIVCDYTAFWLPSKAHVLEISSVFLAYFLHRCCPLRVHRSETTARRGRIIGK